MATTAYDIIKRPIITEQSMEQTEMKRYTFEVAKVNTINVSGKAKRMGAGRPGTTRSWKKAYVQLTADSKTIEMFEGMV